MEKRADETAKTSEIEIVRLRGKEAAEESAEVIYAREQVVDLAANERPVNIEINGEPRAVVMALPGGEEELAAGFVLGEGLIRDKKDLLLLRACAPEKPADGADDPGSWPVLVKVVIPVEMLGDRPAGAMVRYACGSVGEDSAPKRRRRLSKQVVVQAAAFWRMLGEFNQRQEIFRATGGTHAAALFSVEGELAALREDIGRHNAVDRVLGWALMNEIDVADKVLLTSGRASADLVFKALSAGVAVLASLSAPTGLAVNWAREGGLTLVGFVRGRRLNIYSHEERIVG